MDANYATSQNTTLPLSPKVAVVGTSGYSGLELVRLLLRHPNAKLRACFSTQNDFDWTGYLPSARSIPVLNVKDLDEWARELDTVFLATPLEVSLELAPKLLDVGLKVIDLSGGYRLESADDYPAWYHHTHSSPDLLAKAEYGLTPWAGKPKSNLIANPGCYATSILMALLPLVKRDYLQLDSIIVDAKSGTSGAGRKAAEHLLFTEVEGECLPYRISRHQHLPEIQQSLKKFGGGKPVEITFTPHLLNIRRGILSSIYAKTAPGVTLGEINAAFARDYSDYPLIEWGALDSTDSRANQARLSLKRVVGSPLTRVHYQLDGQRLFLFSLLDNLLKGAASQAIENFNRLFDLPLQRGLENLEAVL